MPDFAPVRIPPHLFSQLVNELTRTAVTYSQTQQLRAQLARALQEFVTPDHKEGNQ